MSVGEGDVLNVAGCPPNSTTGVRPGSVKPDPVRLSVFAVTAPPAMRASAPDAGYKRIDSRGLPQRNIQACREHDPSVHGWRKRGRKFDQ